MSNPFFFPIPFATSGDVAPIPEAAQPSGVVSFTTGFTLDYQLDPTLYPATAKYVPRDQTNQLYFQITSALNQYQTVGIPGFIDPSDNFPVAPYSYDFNATVIYDDGFNGKRLYRSNITSNVDLPTVTAKWQILPFYITGTATGTANVLTLNTAETYQTFLSGATVEIKASLSNTNASTLQVGTALPAAINKISSSGLVPLSGGEIIANGIFTLIFDGTVWILQNPSIDTNFIAYTNVINTFTQYQNIPVQYSQVTFNATTSQAIPALSDTKVQFNNVLYDPLSWWSGVNYRFTPTIPGKYRAVCNLVTRPGTTGNAAGLRLYMNGIFFRFLGGEDPVPGTNEHWILTGDSGIFSMNGTTDYIEMYIHVETTAAGASVGAYDGLNGNQNIFEITYVGT